MRTLATSICWVHMGDEQNFIYKIWPQQYSGAGLYLSGAQRKSTYYRLETFPAGGQSG
ncbi:hypothetical protein LN650_23775 [Klebsiella pneumoniae subsp. pneumoniae]|nr:hypothetical protein [Klebsiella pneumoniae subsp. pneumoniae]